MHQLVAPEDAPLCGEDCPHARAGLSAVQCKQILDALDYSIRDTRDYLRRRPELDTMRNELDDTERKRRSLLRLMGME